MASAKEIELTETASDEVVNTVVDGAAALGVKRCFTIPGRDPFDEIEWEIRDAFIPGKDKPVFEQKGVEFPKFWSQTATNIVAQKYFRGRLGSPERESSVKQMIGRIVDTIGGWGRAGGYFATDEEAETFEAELKAILVNQLASFNSPVWFNVGFEEKPQCSACQSYDALISTPEGMVPIGELVEGDQVGREVYDAHGVTRIVAVKHNGRKPIYRVTLRNGSFIEATPDHVVKAVAERRTEPSWLRVDELRPGMRLHLHPHRAKVAERALVTVGGGLAFEEPSLPETTEEQIVATAEAALAGWLQADGFVGQYEAGTNRSLTIEFQVADEDEYGWVVHNLDIALPDVHRHVREVERADGSISCRRIRLYGEVLRSFVEEWGLLARGTEIRVPRRLWTASHDEIVAYLRSIFQADGYVSVRREGDSESGRVAFAVIGEQWAEDVQLLLNVIGIYSRRTHKPEQRTDRHDLHEVSVSIGSERARFAELIGFVGTKKQSTLLASLDLRGLKRCPDLREEEIVSIDYLGVEEVYDIQTESGEYLTNNVAVHNCFILSVDDSMESILDWIRREGIIFRGGSGAGVNLSHLRSSKEQLSKGGYASGPVSFMRGADASAGTIKSGGKTRRAAKMVVLDVDHPDVEEFIWCKAKEEEKARVLESAGYDMSLDSPDWASIQYQNANNSVRVTDAFMEAAVAGGEWNLTARTDGTVVDTVDAQGLLRQIAEAAWRCADPGVQYDTTINKWHTLSNTGRINASNPCFPGDARVHTTLGLIPFAELFERAQEGEELRVYTHRATAEKPGEGVVATVPVAVMRTGVKPIVRLRFANGQELRCTPNHRLWTANRGYVPASELTGDDRVLLNDSPTPALDASWALSVKVEALARSCSRGGTMTYKELPDRWSEQLGELMGHLVGDGCLTSVQTQWVYGGDDVEGGLLHWHEAYLKEIVGGVSRQVMGNETFQLRVGSEAVRELFRGLGVTSARAHEKRVPASVFVAPTEIQAAFLRGLFGADGCVSRVEAGKASRYVGLGSRSEALLKDVQRLLNAFGVRSRIYANGGPRNAAFAYTRQDGTAVEYESREGFDLRITGSDLDRFATEIGFSAPRKQAALESMLAETTRYRTRGETTLAAREEDGQEWVYNLTEPLHHSYLVDGFVVANCSEYMSIDDSACNLASLNLMKFRREDGELDVEAFEHAVDTVFLAQEIVVGYSSYPTPEIERNAKAYRQLGLGYANLGALLIARGLPYDSDEGRAYAAAITALMTGRAYRKSAEIAGRMGPFAGYQPNAAAMLGVISMHRAAVGNIQHTDSVPDDLLGAARQAWDDALNVGEVHGFRNAQATVLAPTGCLVGDSLISTSRGLVRLRSLGNPVGPKWQPLDVDVATDDGPRQATQFYVNGFEQVVSIETGRGYRIQGTPTHRIKVVDPDGQWVWRRFAEIEEGDRVPLMLDGIVGEPVEVELPPVGELHWTSDFRTRVPRRVTPELAELVGYFMGDGSLHAKGLRFCVTASDDDVVDRLVHLGAELFGLEARVAEKQGYAEVTFHSVPLAIWWEACGLAKLPPHAEHSGKGWHSHIPDAILHTNDREVYAAFVRGLFEADGTTNNGYASWSTVTESFSRDVQTLLLALGFVTTRKVDDAGWGPHDRFVLRSLNVAAADRFIEEVGFISSRKTNSLATGDHRQAARYSRRSATALLERTGDGELEHLLGFYYDTVASTEVLDDQPTFDLSVPENVTYVANGFVSHNTISFMMDCDTTGVEPDFSLVKSKKLVGGGEITIVNKTVPMALDKLGYAPTEVEEIVAYIDDRNTIVGAPFVKAEHYPVFDCAIGDRAIHYSGHVKMMGAVQPFICGAISKTVNLPEQATVDEVAQLIADAWRLGVKAIAIYRDNCKVAQPLSGKGETATLVPAAGLAPHPRRRRLPDDRTEVGRKFRVGEYEGYIHVGLFDDGTPGDIFVDIAKEGTTLAGLMNAFMISVSLGLQYGVPLEVYVSKFAHMRFEPSGQTNDADIRIAKSLVDYIFRWMGKKFLTPDQQEEAGILSAEVRARLTERYNGGAEDRAEAAAVEAPPPGQTALFNTWEDAVECARCGGRMVRTGSCYTCRDCGTNTGCS